MKEFFCKKQNFFSCILSNYPDCSNCTVKFVKYWKKHRAQQLKVEQQTEKRQQHLAAAEHAVRRTHGEKKGGGRRAQAKQRVPDRTSAVPPYGAQQIVQQPEPGAQRKGKSQRQGLRADAQLHSAEQPRPEAALARRLLVAQIADLAAHIQLPGVEIGARSHHERYDGTGYPEGLAGDQIPEEARIIAVADAYDAMTSERSYRSAYSQADARREMESGRGTQFDPRFLDIMLDMIDRDENYEMHGTDTDDLLGIVQLRALLGREEERKGALLTNSSGFEEIYHFLRRYARRNACEVQLVLITMEFKNSQSGQDLSDP